MKVVFGGAFNPVTIAHIEVYKYIMDKLEVSEFIFLPVSNAYTKSDLASNYHRLNMLKLALNKYENVTVSEMELEDEDFLGTYKSLIRLYDSNNEKIAFVIGADNLKTMSSWINITGILSEFTIIVLGRNDINIHEFIDNDKTLSKYKDSFIIFDSFNVSVSSTSFRETLDKDKVDDLVYDYIQKNELYRGEEDV